MYTNKLLFLTLLFVASMATEANANSRDDGFYIGLSTSFFGFGGDSYTEDPRLQNKIIYDADDFQTTFKVGYQHFKKNRIEIYARENDIEAHVGSTATKAGDISTKTFGVNYEWGIASAKNVNQKMMPFISLGYGRGTAKSTSTTLLLKKATVNEFEAKIGLRYQLGNNFDVNLNYSHKFIDFLDVKNSSGVVGADTSLNTLGVGINYHF